MAASYEARSFGEDLKEADRFQKRKDLVASLFKRGDDYHYATGDECRSVNRRCHYQGRKCCEGLVCVRDEGVYDYRVCQEQCK